MAIVQDRRAGQRLELRARVRAHFVDATTDLALPALACAGWTQDVSVGGIRFSSRKPLALNAIVELDLACTHPVESVRLRGQVGWLCQEKDHGYSIGVFIRESAKDRLVNWRRLLARRGLAV